MVYVLDNNEKPLMPTDRHGKVRYMIEDGRAKVIKVKPFTIQLTYETTGYVQPGTLGIDSGYLNIGFSVVNDKKELVSGEVALLKDMKKRIKERAMYRKQRRSRLRYRRNKGLDNHQSEGRLAPSIQHKLDSHIRFIEKIRRLVPINKIVIEVANFDIQAIKNPGIEGKEYQEGEQSGFWNLREYILHRDKHECQKPECKNKADEKILQVHHIGFWKEDRTDRPGNLLTLCTKCHTPANHKKGKFIFGWQPKLKTFREATFMSMVRWRLVSSLGCEHTYGYATKSKRIELGLEKSHGNDAFCIAGGESQVRSEMLSVKQIRRNNRALEYFYDAKFIDIRTGEKVSGQALFSGRRVRNRDLNRANLRMYRGRKVSKGRRSIRKTRYSFQPGDVVRYQNELYASKGIQNLGVYIRLGGLSKPVKTELVEPYRYAKGMFVA